MSEQQLDQALNRLQRYASDNLPHGSRVDAERAYGAAYQQLVKTGDRPQLRAKYRGQS